MIKLLDKALELVRRLPADSQDEIARAMMDLAAGDGEPEQIEPAHLSAVLQGLARPSAGNSQPTKKLRLRSAALTHEASLHAASGSGHRRNCRLHSC